jgi:chorismate mutase
VYPRAASLLLVLGLTGLAFAACEPKRRPGYVSVTAGGEGGENGSTVPSAGSRGGSSSGGSACEELPPLDLSDLCDDAVSQVTVRKPNLQFLLDVSGSMSELISNSGSTSKLAASKQAILRVARDRGARLNLGLAAFPALDRASPEDACTPGRELLAMTPGDPLLCGKPQSSGPVLGEISDLLLELRAGGGTPLSPSIAALSTDLVTLKGSTALLVLTDGAPNCNPDATCNAEECAPSVYREYIGDIQCGPTVNCCDSSVIGHLIEDPGAFCFDDDDSIKRISDLKEAGVRTFIVGVPGADELEDLMNKLAEAGGTARSGVTKFFDVADTDELDQALDEISREVALPCELELAQRLPRSRGFDCQHRGWLELRGWKGESPRGVVRPSPTGRGGRGHGRPGMWNYSRVSGGSCQSLEKMRGSAPVIDDPEIDWLRQEIDSIDDEILRLVERRLACVLKVGDRKRERSLPVYDPNREEKVMARLLARAQDPTDAALIREVFSTLVRECRRIEIEKH